MAHRQCLRPVLGYVIGGVDDETSFRTAALDLGLDYDGNGAGHDASRRPVVARYGVGRNDPCEVEAALPPRLSPRPPISRKRLSGLDLSGLNLSGAIFRAARLNRTKLAGAQLDRAVLDQAWLLEADLTGASLKSANLFASQMARARLDGADLTKARSQPI